MTHTAIMLNGHTDPTSPKIQSTQTDTSHILPNMCQKLICPSNAKYMPHMHRSSFADIRQLFQYISHINSSTKNVTTNTGIHTFHIISISL